MRTLILELPDEKVEVLERTARWRCKSVNEVVTDLVSNLATDDDGYDVTQDPIYNIKPSGTSGVGDLSTNHDHYLYGAKKRT